MSKDKTIDLGPSTTFLEENTTTDAKGVVQLSKSGYVQYFEENGVTKATLDAVQAGTEKLYGGMINVAARRLEKAVAEAKKSGDDPDELTQAVQVAIPGGNARVEVKAKSVSPNPRHAEHGGPKNIVKYGQVSLKVKQKSLLPGQAVDDAHALIKGALGAED